MCSKSKLKQTKSWDKISLPKKLCLYKELKHEKKISRGFRKWCISFLNDVEIVIFYTEILARKVVL